MGGSFFIAKNKLQNISLCCHNFCQTRKNYYVVIFLYFRIREGNEMVYILRLMIVIACVSLLGSCSQGKNVNDSQLALMKTTNPNPIVTEKNNGEDKVKKIEKEVSNFDELYDVAVVKGKKDTLVVYKVKHMQRFKMKKIEKDLTKRLKKNTQRKTLRYQVIIRFFLKLFG